MSAGGLKLQAAPWDGGAFAGFSGCSHASSLRLSRSGNTVGAARMLLELHAEGTVEARALTCPGGNI